MERDITKNTELRNEAWTWEDAANERIHELEFYVEDLEMDNAILHENVHMMYAQLHPPHGDGEVTDEEMIVNPGEVENEEEEEDPKELVYFSDEDEVSSDMDTDADDWELGVVIVLFCFSSKPRLSCGIQDM